MAEIFRRSAFNVFETCFLVLSLSGNSIVSMLIFVSTGCQPYHLPPTPPSSRLLPPPHLLLPSSTSPRLLLPHIRSGLQTTNPQSSLPALLLTTHSLLGVFSLLPSVPLALLASSSAFPPHSLLALAHLLLAPCEWSGTSLHLLGTSSLLTPMSPSPHSTIFSLYLLLPCIFPLPPAVF